MIELYWVLLGAMLSSFSGLSSLPVLRHELVEKRQWIDDRQLNAAVMMGRSTPGPMGVYVVSVGYFVAGPRGAAAGTLALATPALLGVLLLRQLERLLGNARGKTAVRYVILAGAAYNLAALYGMSLTALRQWGLVVLAVAAGLLFLRTKWHTIVILGAAGLAGVMLHY